MASIKLSVHIPPDSNPVNINGLLTELAKNSELIFESPSDLMDFLLEQGIGSRTEIQSTATSMGILKRTTDGIRLSPDGLALAQTREDVRRDLFHFLMYTGWSEHQPTEFLQSWAYRQVCDQYWALGTVELNSSYLDRHVGEIISLAHDTFAEMNVGAFDEISFSRKSITGAHNWLKAVNPPVIENKEVFKRRAFCPPELLIMVIGYVLRNEDNITGIDILLTPEKRDAICRVCLLEPDAFDRALDWAIPIFSSVISPGTTAGFYGRFIRLNRLPSLRDVVR